MVEMNTGECGEGRRERGRNSEEQGGQGGKGMSRNRDVGKDIYGETRKTDVRPERDPWGNKEL